MKRMLRWILSVFIALAAVQSRQSLDQHAAAAGGSVALSALSTDPELVTGGDVLIQVVVPAGTARGELRVTASGRDVTAAFRPAAQPDIFLGLVTGLPLGPTNIVADVGHLTTSLVVTNYPITGPVISGPWQQPFFCQTDAFVLPDGTTLGSPLDENCSARTVVQYVYRPTSVEDAARPFKPLPNPNVLPPDVSKTTTVTGQTVNFIVRVETGTMNRGIYQNAVLHDPTVDPPPTPFAPPKGWNRRLIAMHGSGCPSGWYIQGAAEGVNVLDARRLAEGYALFINTLNHPTNSCNAFLAGETTMMGKEHFIETFGVPMYTMSTGGSGGAYTSLQVADAFPGLIDGVDIRATFPDALSIALSGLDAHLLTHYFSATNPAGFSEAQQVAVSGYAGLKAFIDAANQAQRTDPVPNRKDIEGYLSARWNAAVPIDRRYDPIRNPGGARPTVFDAARNIYGVNPATGAALRPYDNTGVQYGLKALNSGAISVSQFLELNERIGGYDQDANYAAARSIGDAGAIRRAYQAGLTLGANGGLTAIPIFDNATSNEAGGYHYGWFHYALRERLRKARGGASDNMVMWRSINGDDGRVLFDTWMAAYRSDTSNGTQLEKVLRAKPAAAVEGCYDRSTPPAFIAEPLAFTSAPTTKCSALYPVYANPRFQSGGPLAADILKCQLKPVDPGDYAVSLSAADVVRLKTIFPDGVCDWSKPGVNQVPVVPWASFGPSPRNRVS
ncbi:MAG TPA: DUF6351 family protein [Vicinamibacterales bacterium]|nr:DUF6351 family protein [Vicinamibacterales bacterium]